MSQKLNHDEFFNILKKIPKAEIHLHIEAVSTIQTVNFTNFVTVRKWAQKMQKSFLHIMT